MIPLIEAQRLVDMMSPEEKRQLLDYLMQFQEDRGQRQTTSANFEFTSREIDDMIEGHELDPLRQFYLRENTSE